MQRRRFVCQRCYGKFVSIAAINEHECKQADGKTGVLAIYSGTQHAANESIAEQPEEIPDAVA
jgi:hypothetical protein